MNLKPHYYVTLVRSDRKTLQTSEVNCLFRPENRKKLSQLDVAISVAVPTLVLRRAREADPDAVEKVFRHLMMEITGFLALRPDEFMVHYDSLGYGMFMDFLDMAPIDRTKAFLLFHKNGKVDPRVVGQSVFPVRIA